MKWDRIKELGNAVLELGRVIGEIIVITVGAYIGIKSTIDPNYSLDVNTLTFLVGVALLFGGSYVRRCSE